MKCSRSLASQPGWSETTLHEVLTPAAATDVASRHFVDTASTPPLEEGHAEAQNRDHPHALVIDSKDRVLVLDEQVDAQKPRVQIFDQQGKFLEQWANIGGVLPTGIAIADDDTVYISDADANSITIFRDGKKLDEIPYVQARPHNLALDRGTGILYLVDPITPMRQGGGESRGPNPGGGLVKKVVKRS